MFPILYGGVEAADLKIGVLNLPHETYRLKQKEYDFIREKLAVGGSIISLMDNDMTGYREAIWLVMLMILLQFLFLKNMMLKILVN